MEPSNVSNRRTDASLEPTAEEVEAGASLTLPPERLESRASDAPPPPPPAVQNLVHQQDAAAPLPPAAGASTHRGIALSVGANLAVGPIAAVGGEVSVGVVVDFSEPDISVFVSRGWGSAEATMVSGGVSAQASYVHDLKKFWGSGVELGLNTPQGSLAANLATSRPGAEPELNGVTISRGPGIGADIHVFETSTERLIDRFDTIAEALRRAASLPSPRRFGP